MKLNQLEYFCAAVRCRSITQAAQKLYVTQPAISNAIRALEKEFSVVLFAHTKNKLTLTEEGQQFYEQAQQLLHKVDEATKQFQDLGACKTPVRVGIPPMLGSTFFPDLLQDFWKKYPDIRLTFFEYGSARAADLVQAEELEVALVNLQFGNAEKFHSLTLARDRFVVAVSPDHPYAKRELLTLEDLQSVPLILFNTDSVQIHTIQREFDALDIESNVILYTSQIYTMKSMVHSGKCAAFFYESMLEDHPDLVGIPLKTPIEQDIGLIWRKGKYVTNGIKAFTSFVKDYPLFPEHLSIL